MSSHLPLTGTDDPKQFASPVPAENVSMLTIRAVNNILPSRMNNLSFTTTGIPIYQDFGSKIESPRDEAHLVEMADKDTVLGNMDINASPCCFVGQWSLGNAKVVNFALSYAALVAALKSGNLNTMRLWWESAANDTTDSNWTNFKNSVGVDAAVQKAISTALTAAADGLPAL